MLELGRIGIAINTAPDDAHLAEAVELERLGYSTLWLPGGQLDSLDRLRTILGATRSVRVAPGIIPVDRYRAEEVARFDAEMAEAFPGRLVVGLGGPQTARPLSALCAYLDELDNGDPSVPAERRILAALGPRKLELARDRAAGAIALLVTPDYTAAARQRLGEDAILVIDQMVVLDSDADRARESARGPLRFLSRVTGYASNFERMGFTAQDVTALPDRLVDALVVWGDVDTIAERVAAHRAAGADHVVVTVGNSGDQLSPIRAAGELAEAFIE